MNVVVEPYGSASTWFQTHTPIHPHTVLLRSIVEACPCQTPSQPLHPLNMSHAPSHAPCPNNSHKPAPRFVKHPDPNLHFTLYTNRLSTTFPCTKQSKSNVKQNTECTFIFTFHSHSRLHA